MRIFPDSPREMATAAGHCGSLRAPERALDVARALLEISPDYDNAKVALASSLAKLNRVDEGLSRLQPLADAEGAPPRTRLIYAMMLARAGEQDRAREIVEAVRASPNRVAESHLAITYGWLGDHDEAICWLRLADEKGEFGLCYLPFEPS